MISRDSDTEGLVILGVDPGTMCGWAVMRQVCQPAKLHRIASGVLSLKPNAHEGAGVRYLKLRRSLQHILSHYNVDVIGYEIVRRHKGTAASHIYGGIVATIQTLCEQVEIPYQGVSVQAMARPHPTR